MDEKDMIEDDKLERIVGLQEEGKQLSDEELAWLMHDDEAMDICRELQNCKNAVARRADIDGLDIENEWEQFKNKERSIPFAKVQPESTTLVSPNSKGKKSHRFFWGAMTGMAASFLIILGCLWWEGFSLSKNTIVAFQAVDSVQQVMLQTSAGNRIALARNTKAEALGSIGTLYNTKDTLELAYSANKPAEEIETHLLSTPRGQDFKITLEDGTVVWMNAESRLEYPSKFVGKSRMVHLQGEAYFKVAKNANCPFIICTDKMQIQVLGTELNVRNYALRDSHVTLINGSVEVRDNKNAENVVRLKPGEDALWKENEAFEIKDVDIDSYICWRDGYFYFDDKPLGEVMQEIGRWYNINVQFKNKELMDMRIRYFCVRSETLERAIDLLNKMKKIHATLSDNTVYIR